MTVSPRSGFSLIELMVALAVLSIAGLALLNAVQQSTRTTAILESRSLARLAADNILNERLARSGALAEDNGRYEIAHRVYNWSLVIEPHRARKREELKKLQSVKPS